RLARDESCSTVARGSCFEFSVPFDSHDVRRSLLSTSSKYAVNSWGPEMIQAKTTSARVRERLNHPVVDADGHFVEMLPLLEHYTEEVGGSKVLARYRADFPMSLHNLDGPPERVGGPLGWNGLTPQERRDKRVTRGGFWVFPTGRAIDRATIMLPKL